jgi:hypothetical protein
MTFQEKYIKRTKEIVELNNVLEKLYETSIKVTEKIEHVKKLLLIAERDIADLKMSKIKDYEDCVQ